MAAALLGLQRAIKPRSFLSQVWRPTAGLEKNMKKIKNDHPFANERLLEYDRLTGIKTYASSSGRYGEVWAIRHEFEDVQPEVDASRELAKHDDHWKDGVKKSWLHYAHIPDSVLLQWHVMGVDINSPAELTKMVNKPEYAYLRCTPKIHVAKQ